jgi:hypothetical protein
MAGLSESTPLLQSNSVVDPGKNQVSDPSADVEKSEAPQTQDTKHVDLVVDISPTSNYWDQKYAAAHELFYRNLIGMHLDAAIYPYLPTTPLPIRLIFKLPSIIFPKSLRDYLIAYFLSIQFLVLCSAFDYHPYLGALPVTSWWTWRIISPMPPEWACRWQWNTMIVISHLKIVFWAGLGRWLLGMREVYEEYTPERLRDALPKPEGVVKVGSITEVL